MSRWLWALLGGVVLVAIAALFWTAGNQTNVKPPVSPGPTAVVPAPAPAPPASAPVAQRPAPPPPPTPALPTAQETASAPTPSPTAPPAPTPAPDARQQAATPTAPPLSLATPSAPPVAEAPLPPPAPGREASETQDVYAPKSLAQLVGTWAYSAEDCGRLFQRSGGGWAYRQPVDKFAQAAIVESTKKILLPSAICRIEGASEAEGALKVSADCEDSISYTSRSVMIALRSATELVYSASGDPALATTLKKCAP
ncbi:MAG: hypothetical protein WB715_24685 [Roseiarcus sp.]|uniref:hypothetical protein n=1 Tax=Roseiarcus sp. TaxID=1969460 RepID=UPI003C523C6E